MPILEPEYVADSIVRAVRANQAVLITPRFCYIAPLVRFLFPTPLFDAVAVRYALYCIVGWGKRRFPRYRLCLCVCVCPAAELGGR
jgi:hypothetical protein